jgi:four helix bundle protein
MGMTGMSDADARKPLHYKELKVWKKGMELVRMIYQLTARLPTEEKYGLASQMRRAAVSVPSNIAEGQARQGTREFLQFLSHASGSLAELETQTLLCVDLNYCNLPDITKISGEIAEPQKILAAIRRKLQERSH